MDDAGLQQELIVRGGLCLLPGEGLVPTDIVCAGGEIAELRTPGTAAGRSVDAHGCLVLPGIVDIHGDAFERQVMPRPKTVFPLEIAMLETDRQLAANGITTAYHGITVSWEPGLRSLQQAHKIIDVLDRLEDRFLVDHRIHIRWETFALDEMAAVQALFSRAKQPLLAFNDHTTPALAGARSEIKLRGSAERAMLDVQVSPKETLIDYLKNAFPIRQMRVFRADDGAVRAEPMTRIDCSPPATCARPPGALRFSRRSCWFTSTAVTPSACMRAGSSSMRISRFSPPPRDTCATPGSDSKRLLTELSTNQLNCSGVRPVVPTA